VVAVASAPADAAPAPVAAPAATPPAEAPVVVPAAVPAAALVAESPAGPRYVTDGFVAPQLVNSNCISDNLRLPAQLGGATPETVTVRVAVGATGVPTLVQVMGPVADPRISEAIRRAVLACEWTPGADTQGRPTLLWVVQPIRLVR